jgi:hypothetical protein
MQALQAMMICLYTLVATILTQLLSNVADAATTTSPPLLYLPEGAQQSSRDSLSGVWQALSQAKYIDLSHVLQVTALHKKQHRLQAVLIGLSIHLSRQYDSWQQL